jgi:multiple sugar transport system permease protein
VAEAVAVGAGGRDQDRVFRWISVGPALLVLVIVGLLPLLYSVWISLQDYDLVKPPATFAGLDNYVELLTDGRFLHALAFTVMFALLATVIEVVVGFVIAWILADRQVSSRFSSAIRTLLMIPYMVAPVVMAYIFKTLVYDPTFGYLNYFLGLAGLPPFTMFEGTVKPIAALLAMDVVLRTPFVVLILYAGISSLPEEVLEAAAVDGASSLRRITAIVLPMLRPIVAIAFVFRFMDALKIFDEIYVITGGGPGYTTESVSVFATSTAFQYFRMGYATAATVVFCIVVLGLTSLMLRGTRFEAQA